MAKQLFTGQHHRAQTRVDVPFADLYRLVRIKLDSYHPDTCDPDAFCQDLCVQLEKQMGIFPNVPELKKVDD